MELLTAIKRVPETTNNKTRVGPAIDRLRHEIVQGVQCEVALREGAPSQATMLCSESNSICGKVGWSISEAGGLVKSTIRIVVRALDKNEPVSLANLSVNIRLFVASQ